MLFSRHIRRSRRISAFDRNVIIALVTIGVIVSGLSVWRFRYTPEPIAVDSLATATVPQGKSSALESQPAKSTLLPRGWKLFGGIARPSTDVRVSFQDDNKGRKKIYKLEGPNPTLAMNASAETVQIAEALLDKRGPSTLSSSFVPTSFEKARFLSDSRAYAEQYAKDIEPGRVFAPAQPGEGVSVIRSDGERFHRVNQGESVRLMVNAPVDSPITYTSFRLGSFSNNLTSITVVADRNGKAEALFTATSGTIAEIPVIAASPVTSGQVRFVVSVQPKQYRPSGPLGVN